MNAKTPNTPTAMAAKTSQTYTYTVRDAAAIIHKIEAESLSQAAEMLGMKIRTAFYGVAVLTDTDWQYGVTWEPSEKQAEHAALVAVAEAASDWKNKRGLEQLRASRSMSKALANLAAVRGQTSETKPISHPC